jgi:putative PIN family toxin of toxin-antitoxin system
MLPIVVFDTNILISTVLSRRGTPSRCLQLAKEAKIISVTCQEILDELEEKLQNKFAYSLAGFQDEIQEVLKYSQLVRISNTLNVITNDPDDNMVLECAVLGNATHIVTGDKKHLLPLGNYQGIAIVTAADFLNLIST